ncbi:MAG: hypothetical protein H6828_13155 [Planctomycetes bacterium]|nr:hypothetical protein [Planctomycetota bacterium]
MKERVTLHGEGYLTIEAIAECFHVDVAVVRESYELGLFGEVAESEGRVVLHVRELERVATIVRWHVHLGVELTSVALLLD